MEVVGVATTGHEALKSLREDLADLIAASPAIGFLGKASLSAATIEGLVEAAGPV